MSLDYDTTRIDEAKRAEVFPPDEAGKMHDALHVLIWMTMAIDIGEITEKNVDEFWTRVWIWQKVVGSGFNKAVQVRPPVGTCDAVDAPPHEKDSTTVPCKDWTVTDDGLEWQPYLLTRDHVEAAVGLRTNVFPKSSKTEFMKKVYAAAERMCKA